MRLDRNCGPFGKYIVLRAKDGKGMSNTPGDENEAVVIMVKDKHAQEGVSGLRERLCGGRRRGNGTRVPRFGGPCRAGKPVLQDA
jgi:hypothetical protein